MNETIETAVETVADDPAQEQPIETAAAEPAAPPAEENPPAEQEAEKPAAEDPADLPAEEQPAEEPAPDIGALTQRLAQAELRAAAAAAGVPAAKLPYVAKLCETAPLCEKGADMGALAAEQVAKVLRDLPELGAAAAVGSLGDHRRLPAESEESRVAAAFAKYL